MDGGNNSKNNGEDEKVRMIARMIGRMKGWKGRGSSRVKSVRRVGLWKQVRKWKRTEGHTWYMVEHMEGGDGWLGRKKL